ncbi:MAG: HEPN domain-containing protein [Bacteroidetes bacterium]|jgi:uncharacterized protein (UPF0332 family)|nr:HEPN domain-containing protein [Bacteroidota bacterium]
MNSREDRAALAYGRIDQAHEALDAARLLLGTGHYRGTINRAYYAIFYGILGLLVTRELGTSSHSGALTLFSREFIKTGLLPRRLSKLARHAFDARLHVDYEALAEIPREEAEATLQDAEVFLREVTELLPKLVNDLE